MSKKEFKMRFKKCIIRKEEYQERIDEIGKLLYELLCQFTFNKIHNHKHKSLRTTGSELNTWGRLLDYWNLGRGEKAEGRMKGNLLVQEHQHLLILQVCCQNPGQINALSLHFSLRIPAAQQSFLPRSSVHIGSVILPQIDPFSSSGSLFRQKKNRQRASSFTDL